MKITFGIINYNRLYYLKSCAESLMESVKDYDGDLEFFCIDDNSKEKGTQEYLQTLKDRGWEIINQENYRKEKKVNIKEVKDHIDEYSAALNILHEKSSGDLIVPLQGDMQFIRKNWLEDYVSLFSERDDVFVASLDAQRKTRLNNACFVNQTKHGNNIFAVNPSRIVPGAGDCFYKREYLDAMGGWQVGKNKNSEDLFTMTANKVFPNKKVFVPWIPVSIAIYTDPRGTMGRVRGNTRYGLYWEALEDDMYYEWVDIKDLTINKQRPLCIEEMACAKGEWDLPIDEQGNWKKNPINWPVETENVPYKTIY
jgi:glycosyltransferase involved in cell wall biosynthesis